MVKGRTSRWRTVVISGIIVILAVILGVTVFHLSGLRRVNAEVTKKLCGERLLTLAQARRIAEGPGRTSTTDPEDMVRRGFIKEQDLFCPLTGRRYLFCALPAQNGWIVAEPQVSHGGQCLVYTTANKVEAWPAPPKPGTP